MTVWGMVASVVWAGVVGYLGVQVLPRLLTGLLTTWVERAYAVGESGEEVPLPKDIVAFITSHGEEWAREDVEKVARERYAKFHGSNLTTEERWNLVRQALSIGTM